MSFRLAYMYHCREVVLSCVLSASRHTAVRGEIKTTEYGSHGEDRTAASQLRRVGLGKPIRHLAPENCLFSAVRAPR